MQRRNFSIWSTSRWGVLIFLSAAVIFSGTLVFAADDLTVANLTATGTMAVQGLGNSYFQGSLSVGSSVLPGNLGLLVGSSYLTIDKYTGYVGLGTSTPGYGFTVASRNAVFNAGDDGEIGSWNSGYTLPQALQNHSALVVNGFLYVIGGQNPSFIAQATVYYSKLGSDGSNGPWLSNNYILPSSLEGHAAVSSNGYLYVIGGRNNTGTQQSTVYYAKLNSDGSTDEWLTASSLPVGLDGHASVAVNGYLYTIGGRTPTGSTNAFYYSKINSDGSTGPWLNNANGSLPVVINTHSSVVANGYVYVIGGASNGVKLNTVYYAGVKEDGTTTGWSNANALPRALQDMGVGVINDYLYVLGGFSNFDNGIEDAVYFAKLNNNGTIGQWINNSDSLPQELENLPAAVGNGFIYMTGGAGIGGNKTTVYYSSGPRVLVRGALSLGGDVGSPLSVGDILSRGTLTVRGNSIFMNSAIIHGRLTVDGDAYVSGSSTVVDLFIKGNLNAATSTVSNLAVIGNATSTFTRGIRLTSGCFELPDGNCLINSNGLGGTVNAGTLSRLSFYTGSNILSSANFLVVDSVNSRLGVGTTTPAKSLSVNGDELVSGNLDVGGVMNAQSLNTSGAVNIGGNVTVSGNGTSTFSNGLSVANLKVNNIAELSKLAVTATATSTFSGGIKLNSGCFELVDGTCLVNGGISGGASGTINSGSLSRLAYYFGDTALSSANFLALDTVNSRLGIGTSTPDQTLTVVGTFSNLLQQPMTLPILASHAGLGVAGNQRDVAVMGSYAFVANGGPLRVFSIASTTPALIGFAGIMGPRGPIGDGVSGLWLAGQYLYGLDTITNPDTLRIFDISNPAAPVQVGSTATSFDTFIFVIGTVQGNFFYTHQGGTFEVYDLSNPQKPYRRSVIPMVHLGASNAITVDGRYAYNGGRRINIVDISNPDAPRVTLENTSACGFGSIGGGGMAAANGLLFVTTGSSPNLCILDVSDPTKLTVVSNTPVFSLVNQYASMKVQGRYLYAFAKESNNVEIVDISNPKSPQLVSVTQVRADTTGHDIPRGVLAGRRLYYVEGPSIGDGRLWVLDIPGSETGSINASNIRTGDIESVGRVQVQKELHVKGGVNVGLLGLYSSGPLGIAATNTPSSILGSLYVGASTPAPTDAEYSIFSQSTLVAKAKSFQSVPLTILGFAGQIANYLQIKDSISITKLVLDASGRLGIGTSSPTEKLSVIGNVSANKALLNKIQLADEVTGQPYCVSVVSGVLTTTPGNCN